MRHAVETTPHRRFGSFTPKISEAEYIKINNAIEALAAITLPDGESREGKAVVGSIRNNLASTVNHARTRLNREFVKYSLRNPYARMTDADVLQRLQDLRQVPMYADRYDGKSHDGRAETKRGLQAEAAKRGLI